jgi:hypothetical protein
MWRRRARHQGIRALVLAVVMSLYVTLAAACGSGLTGDPEMDACIKPTKAGEHKSISQMQAEDKCQDAIRQRRKAQGGGVAKQAAAGGGKGGSCHWNGNVGKGYRAGGIDSVDPGVVKDAYQAARAAGIAPNDRIMLALFEAGLVESHFHNYTTASDHDSLGYLQQRPSQGWGSGGQVTNVAYATNSFISHARGVLHCGPSAGRLAQAVQRSGFGARYDLWESQARELIRRQGG